jgi:hypothetical protein
MHVLAGEAPDFRHHRVLWRAIHERRLPALFLGISLGRSDSRTVTSGDLIGSVMLADASGLPVAVDATVTFLPTTPAPAMRG